MVQEEIRNFIMEELFVEKNVEWNNDTDIMSTGLLDSLSVVKLLVFIEDTYEISLDDVLDLDNFKTVNTISDIVNKKLAEK